MKEQRLTTITTCQGVAFGRSMALLAAVLLAGIIAAPRAEAVSATGGSVTNYTDAGGKTWVAHIFTNASPYVNQVPTMTASNAPSGVASASSDQGATYAAWKAMDKNNGTRWGGAAGLPAWLQYQFASSTVINGYEFRSFSANSTPSNFTLQASNDGSTWTTLDTQSGKTAWTQYYAFNNTNSYTYYRLNVTAVAAGGTAPSLNEFNLYGSLPSLTVTAGGDVEYLVVGAGGAGGTEWDTGGGGAGGMLTGTVTLAAGTYTPFVGFGATNDLTAIYDNG